MSIELYALNAILRFTVRRRFRKNPDLMELRAIMQESPIPKVPARVKVEQIRLGGVPTEKLQTAVASSAHALLYMHGGGFVAGVPANHRALTWRLAEQTGIPVYAIDYRLAPEHPFPAALDDCLAAYRALLDEGIAPGAIAVGGDSAGGNLTLALALKLKAIGLPQPGALICLSPATDLAEPAPSHATNAKTDVLFDPRIFETVGRYYFPDHDPRDPLLSPLRGDPQGLPPTLFQASDAEMLRDDSLRMAEKMRVAGVAVTVQITPKVFHIWQVTADVLPEARAAIAKIVSFLKDQLALKPGA